MNTLTSFASCAVFVLAAILCFGSAVLLEKLLRRLYPNEQPGPVVVLFFSSLIISAGLCTLFLP